MRIALTGATGLIGRFLVEELATAGHALRCLARPTSNRTDFSSRGLIDWILGDLADPTIVEHLVTDRDAVVHAALERPAGASFRAAGADHFERFLTVNLLGSLRLMEAARRSGVGRFVLLSTCAVHEVILDDRPLDETHPVWPKTHYGAHKAALEAFVVSFGKGASWPICALRPSGVYGIARPIASSKWYDLVKDLVAGKPVSVAGGGKEVHARDVARAVQLLLQADVQRITGEMFNCCDRYIANFEVAALAKEIAGSRSEIHGVPAHPKHEIRTDKLRELGMTFGGTDLLRRTLEELIRGLPG